MTRLEKDNNQIILDDGQRIQYDKLLVATGGDPRKLPIPGIELENVFVVREIKNNEAILEAMKRRADPKPRVVIIGASFIGLESAAMLVRQAQSVTVVGIEQVPLERVLGPQVGGVFQRLHERNGVRFRLGTGIKAFVPSVDDVQMVGSVELSSGEILEADLVVMGVGVRPQTDFVRDALPLEIDQSLRVDAHMQVIGHEGRIYAAGDLATFPQRETGRPVRIEHWDVAQQQGRVAGHNMALGRDAKLQSYNSVPFFFSLMYGKSLRYTGDAHEGYDDLVIDGDLETDVFAVYYASTTIPFPSLMNINRPRGRKSRLCSHHGTRSACSTLQSAFPEGSYALGLGNPLWKGIFPLPSPFLGLIITIESIGHSPLNRICPILDKQMLNMKINLFTDGPRDIILD